MGILLLRYFIFSSFNPRAIYSLVLLKLDNSHLFTSHLRICDYIIPIAKGLQNYDNNAEEFSYYENLAYFGLHQNLTDEQLEELRKAQIIARSKGLNCVE